MSKIFELHSNYQPSGDQPKAIQQLTDGIIEKERFQTLLGVTGSGKTFTMANVIQNVQKPTLIIAHNKTLAAQLCNEFRQFFPKNAVEYFVSYYDYYQPEAYLPRTDTYIEKEAQINQEIDRLRHATTQALLSREDVIIVASVSCIYNIGSPQEYQQTVFHIKVEDEHIDRVFLIHKLIEMQFIRTNTDLQRGHFRSKGDVLELMPMNEEMIYRIIFEDESIREILLLDPVTRNKQGSIIDLWLFPAKHYVIGSKRKAQAITAIRQELEARLKELDDQGKVLEAERLSRRTRYDLELIQEIGYCNGIENYSRYFDGRLPGEAPYSLLEYFPKDFLTIIDESHVTIPQVGAMYEGDRSRKNTLIDYGFRLPCARDNRPLRFEEFEERLGFVVFTSATPGAYEQKMSSRVVEQIIRPTGLVDPVIFVRGVVSDGDYGGQVNDLITEILIRSEKKERTLVTTLTKKMAEDLTEYLQEKGVKVQYLHSDVKTIDRIGILTDLRKGIFDVLVGVNLLREGLDLPEVSLVAIMDADKEGFLRSETSIIQTIGRAARNVEGTVILYADQMTGSLKRAIQETERRRSIQIEHNKKEGITPKSIKTVIGDIRALLGDAQEQDVRSVLSIELTAEPHEIKEVIKEKEEEMKQASRKLDFETAAILRDEIIILNKELKKKKK
ncbi:MAG: UvrABC system protein B [Candidatus Uhrbacteria bacterium GW2011_GWE2_40_58]|nr:MAG: UvrABC system protein B [Candidatus Uhrbacteria bacterium GW2011_GWF2_40_263]KKR67557.1 MAG: UvrABC system protein B [Candidatus Uhrbacteria bacterium GW2011_GWE2_40_58]OGL93693.1 MAG: excinuclease ABC subunit B [Candidatus Uhrbacteria bacterium RIFOXYA2_FULL_40_9]OGL96482.1 MAG: excinuclease ABC subunit B [Candidatus Uhrbacteria bacterium RIFOXYB2_FULL_41_18]HBK34581.1 excinuclease ABC subunit B [Candidatus Uhrbacteria bacterium]